ncbi:NUDIX hydrolase [Chloroflexi bacterium TSY]|nr:NUDIX hydrolase [Chloroflexi bacterium TSY]
MTDATSSQEWKILSSEIVFQNRLTVSCDELLKPDGTKMEYLYLAGRGSASVLAFTKQNQVVLTRQYRHPHRRTIFDLPAGGIQEGETPQQAALRELAEETGYQAKTIEKLGHYCPLPGTTSHTCHVFVAHDLDPGATNLDEHEVVDVVLKDWEEVVDMVLNNEAIDGSLVYAVLRYLASGNFPKSKTDPQMDGID